MSNTEAEAEISQFVAAAEAALALAWHTPVRLGDAEVLREQGRNRVLRCPVRDAPDSSPVSVIIKASVGEGEEAFDPATDTHGSTSWRFRNEWAGSELVGELGTVPPLEHAYMPPIKRPGSSSPKTSVRVAAWLIGCRGRIGPP